MRVTVRAEGCGRWTIGKREESPYLYQSKTQKKKNTHKGDIYNEKIGMGGQYCIA